MHDRATVEAAVREVLSAMYRQQQAPPPFAPVSEKSAAVSVPAQSAPAESAAESAAAGMAGPTPQPLFVKPVSTMPAEDAAVPDEQLIDICSESVRQRVLVANPLDAEMMDKMRRMTNARIGAGRAGSRLNTVTMLTLRANHATARDSVFQEVSDDLLAELGLFSVQTACKDKNVYLTRPDLGRKLSEEGRKLLAEKCRQSPRAQIYVSDGLSSKAIEANIRDVLPTIQDGLKGYGIDCGVPFFVKFGRVGVMDEISELLDAEVTCVLLGERPGLSTAESMSAYLAYRAAVGMPEARRTVVSNIHRDGINSVEAGAYIADVIRIMLEKKASGVDLSL